MTDEFRFLKLGLGSRLALAAGLFASGIALELAFHAGVLPGLALIVAGWLPLMLRTATNKPDDQGLEEWRPVTMTEIDRLDDGIRQSRALRRKTRNMGTIVLVAMSAPFLFVLLVGSAIAGRTDVAFVVGNAVALFVPALFFGRVRVFLPKDIDFKMPSFRALLSEPLPEGMAVAPYIRFDKDPAGRDVPEDLRVMLELKRPPEDLVGVQVQAAINKGPNGAVPYLYAVVLTRGSSGPAYAKARRIRARGFEVEPGADGDYGTVVIRQSTEDGGYHTTPDDCRELGRVCTVFLESLRTA
jgi:hypothetical protein